MKKGDLKGSFQHGQVYKFGQNALTTSGGQRSAVPENQDCNALWEKSEIFDIAYCASF